MMFLFIDINSFPLAKRLQELEIIPRVARIEICLLRRGISLVRYGRDVRGSLISFCGRMDRFLQIPWVHDWEWNIICFYWHDI